MGSTAHPPSEHEPLLADPETRASPLHTGRGVARFLAAIVTTAVLTILALHFTFGPDFGTTVATQVDYEESLPQARTRKAESVLSEITRIANEHAVLVAAAAYIAGGNNANAAGPSATTIQIPPMHQNQSNKQKPPNLGKEKHRRDGGTNHHTDSTDANPSQLRSSGEISSQPDVVRARLRITTSDWHTPMYLISMPNDEREKSRVAISLIKLVDAHGADAVKKLVRLVPGVDASKWPVGLDRAVYALKSVFTTLGGDYLHPDFTLLMKLPWLESLASRDAESGALAPPWTTISHHVGCLFAHMAYWQTSLDDSLQNAFIFESDGLNPSLLSIPVGALGSVVTNAPLDYDLVLLNQPLFTDGTLFSRFADKHGTGIEIREWRERGVAGLGAYLFSKRFVEKIFKHVAKHGADLVDAWLIDKACASDSVDAGGVFVGFDAKHAVTPLLKCYHAVGMQDTRGDAGEGAGEGANGAASGGVTEGNGVAAVGLRKRVGEKKENKDVDVGGDARASAAKEARTWVSAKTAEVNKVRALFAEKGLRTTADTLR